MSARSPTHGHDIRGFFLHEDAGFNQTPNDSDHKPFGRGATISTKEGAHNAQRVFPPNSNVPSDIIEQTFDGSWRAEFILSNPWWLRSIYGSPTKAGSSAPYTYTYDGSKGDPLRIFKGNENVGWEEELRGCVPTRYEVSVDVEGNIDVTLNGAYAKAENINNLTTQPGTNERPFTFAQASLDVGGTTYTLVQSVTLTVNTGAEILQEIGDRFGVDFAPRAYEYDLSYNRIVEDNTEVERFYGGSSTMQQKITNSADITLLADNGETGADKNTIKFALTGAKMDSLSEQGLGDEEQDVEAQVEEMALDATVTAENSQSSAR